MDKTLLKNKVGKRKRLSNLRRQYNSSNESLLSTSNYMLTESERSSDSDFEEHPYSQPMVKRTRVSTSLMHSDNAPKEGMSFEMITTETMRSRTKPKCTTKNAIMARMNRLKKKKYIANLESKNSRLEAENVMLKNLLNTKTREVVSLQRETVNLRSVIRNSTEVGSLLRCIHENTNLEISSSLLQNIEEPAHRNSTSTQPDDSNEQLLASEEEGKDVYSNPVTDPSLSIPFHLNDHYDLDLDPDFSLPYELLQDSDNKVSYFDTPSLTSVPTSSNDLLRCETPTKGFDVLVGTKDNLGLFEDVGICFHIGNKKVSLEFCEMCNDKAKAHAV